MWTERYDGGEGWGEWRLKMADFRVRNGEPRLENVRVAYEPKVGNYVTALAFLDSDTLLVAGNLEGQDEYGMDLYRLDIKSGKSTNLLNTPEYWEEGSCVSPSGRHIAFMTNKDSRYKFDTSDKNWASQKVERDYYLMRSDGSNKERLTFFNDSGAPEYQGGRDMVAICEFSPDGKYLAGTLGIDTSTGKKRRLALKIVLIDLKDRL